MAELTDRQSRYSQIVQQLLTDYAQHKPVFGDFEVQRIFDTQRHHYQILHLGWHHKRWVHHCPVHLDVRNEKIWIFKNSTEHDIAEDLIERGVPKHHIVLGFCPPYIREMGDYAVG